MAGPLIDRRRALIASVASGFGLALPMAQAQSIGTLSRRSTRDGTTPRSAIAKTRYGPVRGYVAGDVFTFKGIPYGQDTGGENRWLPAKPPQPWTEPYNALVYGANSPQTTHSFRAVEHTFLQQWDDGFQGEDMLKLNVWTPSLSGNRPVMVYFHGGGFAFGSSYELASHDGAQMARHHDVVQVSINHRLNVLGFLDLVEVGGSAYEESVNVSMTDCIAALRWVQENIAAFGGDPDTVMIYGQSGGGSKVTTLLGMKSGKGLIHRAAAQSGGGGALPTAEQSLEYSRRLVKHLGIAPNDIAALQKVAWADLSAASSTVAGEINEPMVRSLGGPPATPRVGWGPTLDGKVIEVRSFADVAPEVSRNVPMLIGNTSEEGMRWGSNPSEAEWRKDLTGQLGAAKADALIASMRKAHPEKAVRTLSYGVQSIAYRNRVQDMVRLKHVQGGAQVYQYLFQWQSPQLDGLAGAWHTADLAFCFDNTARCEQGTGNTPEAQRLARTMAGAWATFARTGNPSQPGLKWSPSDPVRCQTMVFDDQCRMVDDPEGGSRRILLSA
ncbi:MULTISPECIES: carboxylesterase/lipase family protein [unclassified Sphingomonas]|jgi:para-nitrobenzyl esterase|uniref:carboxylesterase/lipase family protein n=1 Tax=unclassified Sphingomonas TaxID=196159 RepID=UPI0006F2DF9D|nr:MULTISPECIES: carboxylesterase family protein [unclassified Sphingomonas]KQN16599.1 carboxylesterase [Sphingomonas sp. Leaf30]MBB3586391.1 para-nitrobenzyl esterase [Sphingomonas sp. BK481]